MYYRNKSKNLSSNLYKSLDKENDYFLYRFAIFKHLNSGSIGDFSKDQNREFLVRILAETMYEYGYDDAINSVMNLIKGDNDNALLRLSLGASRREINQPICPDLNNSDQYSGDKWIFERDIDDRSANHLSDWGIDKMSMKEINTLMAKRRLCSADSLSELLWEQI